MITLLIIDDDEDDVQIFCEAVQEIDNSIHCSFANNGDEALQFLKDETVKPDFIFLDLNMPRMSGKQFLIQLKKDDSLQHIPVIIYTTTRREEDAREAYELGAAYFLTKPAKFEALKKAIADVLEKRFQNVSRTSSRRNN